MDNSCSEFIFTSDFFISPTKKEKAYISRVGGEQVAPISVFNEVFDPAIKLVQVK